MTALREAPNLGPVLAAELARAGVQSWEHLRQLGAEAAWDRVRLVNPERDCASSLLALEGAIRGVRWMSLPEAERRRLSAQAAARRVRA